jgi:alkane 1-monooxygenase
MPAMRAMAAVPYALGFTLPPLVVWSATRGGAWCWLPVLALYAGLPIVDAIVSRNPLHPSPDEVVALESNIWFRMVTWLWVPVHVALVIWALGRAAELRYGWPWLGLIVSLGSTGGAIGITFAHELIHRSGRVERALGDVLLALVSYPHFAIEHVYGHHRWVATPPDPATARLGEGFYRFLPRTVFGSLAHASAIERERLARRGRSAWHPANRMWRYGLTLAVVYTGVYAWGQTPALVFFVLQGVVAFVLLEAINYVEHYGLVRREVEPGRFEPVAPRHAWDSSHRVSNWLLINLARHADHHMIASRRYPALATRERAPQLPAGYGTMLLVALVPPLWHAMMDARAREAGRPWPA